MRARIGHGILGLASLAALCLPVAPAEATSRAAPPNIIVVQTDDQNAVELNDKTMPSTEKLLVAGGTTFSDYVVATPMCCPSRAALLTGQYPHNDGVSANDPGYPSLVDPANTLPAWLQAAGYRTAHLGKYLNNYADVAGSVAVPAPGWNRWITGGDITRYYNYDLGTDGAFVHYGTAPRDYVTRVLGRQAVSLIRQWGGAARPFYLQLDERAPHESTWRERSGQCPVGPIPDQRDRFKFPNLGLPRPPSFNEPDMSDKPPVIQRLPQLSDDAIAKTAKTYRCRLESLRAVDRNVVGIYRALRATRSLRRTVIVFTSDNGFYQGEHRIQQGKVVPYLEAIHEPLVVRLPPDYGGRDQPRKVRQIAANIDIAPTLLALAHAQPCIASGECRVMDGRSLVPLLRGRTPGWAPSRPILIELSQLDSRNGNAHGVCAYTGVYTTAASFVRYTSAGTLTNWGCVPTDQRELYDLKADPFQLDNLYPAPPATRAELLQATLGDDLSRLTDCSGVAGRDPEPASGHRCG